MTAHAFASFAPQTVPSDQAGPSEPQTDRDWLRDRTVIHKVVVCMHVAHPCLSDLLDDLARSHGLLQSLSVRPTSGGDFEAVLQVTRLKPEAARRLVDRYAAHREVRAASIEHMLVR